MVILSFKSKKDKEKLYEKAKKMEEYATMIVDCLEEAGYDEGYEEESYRRMYRHEDEHYEHPDHTEHSSRYGYRRMK